MENKKDFGLLASSADATKMSTTVTGAMKLVSGVLIGFGLISTLDANVIINQVAIIVPAGYALYGSLETVFGIIRKIVLRFV